MSDRMAAEIWIGGKLRRSLLEEFPIADLCLDWDENRPKSTGEADLRATRDEDGLLHFADAEANWGEFQELEAWLKEHRIPFRRFSEGKYEYPAEIVAHRPDLKGKRYQHGYTLATPEGKPVVLVAEIEKVINRMARVAVNQKRSPTQRVQAWEKLFRALLRVIPPQLPALPRFEIVDG